MIQFITKKNKNTISFTGVVNTFADLPDPTLHNSEFWIVKTSSGFWIFGRKEAGTYYSNGATWERLGQWDIAFRSDNFEVYDSVDNTKALKFDTTGISAGVDRTYTAPDKNGTLALLSDIVSTAITTDINSISGSGVVADPLKISDDAKIVNSLEIGYTGNNTAALSVYEDGFNPNWPRQGINNFTASDSVFEATFTGFKSRGTMAAKTAVQQGDYLGTYSSCAWDGSAWQIGGYITWFIDAPPSPGIVPTSMNLLLAQQSGGYGEIFTFRSNGHLGINSAVAPSHITVNATDLSSGQVAEFNAFSTTEYCNVSFRKSRGGYGVLIETQDLDYLSELSSWGVNSSNGWFYGSSIAVRQTGAATATDAPTQMEFYTNNGAGLQYSLILTKDGNALIGGVTDGMTPGGSMAIEKDLFHKGGLVGFFNTAPVIQQTGGALVAGGAYTANEQTMLNNIWTALKNYGLIN